MTLSWTNAPLWLLAVSLTVPLAAQPMPQTCAALVPGTPIAATNPTAPTVLSLGNATTVQIEILGHSENRGYHSFLQQRLDNDPPLAGVNFVVTNRWIGGQEAYRWAQPGQQGFQRINTMLAQQQHPMIVLGLFSNNITWPIQNPTPGVPNFNRFVNNLMDIADHCYNQGNGATMVYFSSHRYKPSNLLPCFNERIAVEHLVGTSAPAGNRHYIKAGPEQHNLHGCCFPTCYAPDMAHTNAQGDALMAEAWYNLLWRELRGCASTPFGSGTPGTGGVVPVLLPDGGVPFLGNGAFALELQEALPNSLAVFGIGGPAPILSTPLLVQPLATWIAVTDLAGELSLSFPLPAAPNLHGVSLLAQAGALDPLGTFLGFTLTQGIELTFCQ
ncbi:MAG: hypothetical protein VYE77_01110 [Planctomycetota bacterium]|nr:hypothetical protein [Planctomycetota bacterium]